jgi:hypothetical protein
METGQSGGFARAAVETLRSEALQTLRDERLSVVSQFAVAALGARPDLIGERRNPLRTQTRRSETAATVLKLRYYQAVRKVDSHAEV